MIEAMAAGFPVMAPPTVGGTLTPLCRGRLLVRAYDSGGVGGCDRGDVADRRRGNGVARRDFGRTPVRELFDSPAEQALRRRDAIELLPVRPGSD
jgi:hypothetical protein